MIATTQFPPIADRKVTVKEKIKEQEEAMSRILAKQEAAITGKPPVIKWPAWIRG